MSKDTTVHEIFVLLDSVQSQLGQIRERAKELIEDNQTRIDTNKGKEEHPNARPETEPG